MRAVVQRVRWARVRVGNEVVGEIGPGFMTLLGVGHNDSETQAHWLIKKILNLRVFEDSSGKMNRSLLDVGGAHLIVSQFTLYADCTQGNRPGFSEAARPELARGLYEYALRLSSDLGVKTASGRFQAEMEVEILNDGPVTFFLETPASSDAKSGVS
jgi:D-tyrosyl-tRNA(Tyr) deacylase